MEYVELGRTGTRVSRLCLGTVNFGRRTPEDESVAIIHAALDAGINFIDTANIYGRGRSEEVVGRALSGRRQDVILATKVGSRMGDGPNQHGLGRRQIIQELEGSLRRLGTDYVDLYQLHRPDPRTPMEEVLRTLSDLVRQGKIRYVGTSNHAAWQLAHADGLSDRFGFVRFVSEQPQYHLLYRRVERELLPFARRFKLAVIPWSPLAGGLLSGRYDTSTPVPPGSRREDDFWMPSPGLIDRRLQTVEALRELAAGLEMPLSQLAVAWLLHQPAVTAPIIGPRTMEHLNDNLQAAGRTLPAAALERVDELVPPETAA